MKNILLTLCLFTSICIHAQQEGDPVWLYTNNGLYQGMGWNDSLVAFLGEESSGTWSLSVISPDGYKNEGGIVDYENTSDLPYFKPIKWSIDVDTDPGTQANTGSSTFDGEAMETEYIITHGLDYTPSTVLIQAASADACDNSWVSDITSTTFTINFQMAPTTGTDNLSFTWVAYK